MPKLAVVTSQSFTEIRCPGCGTSRAEHLTLITPEVRCAAVLGVTEAGNLLVSEESELHDFPASELVPRSWLFCECGRDFPLPAGTLIATGPKTDAITIDLPRREQRRVTIADAALPIPIERAIPIDRAWRPTNP